MSAMVEDVEHLSDATKALVRARGLWPNPDARPGLWREQPGVACAGFEMWRADGLFHARFLDGSIISVDPTTALLALLVLDLPPVSVPCQDCLERGGRHEWRNVLTLGLCEDMSRNDGWWWGPTTTVWLSAGVRTWVLVRPCPSCSPDLADWTASAPGRIEISVARLVCEAATRPDIDRADEHGPNGEVILAPGDQSAREQLAVKADALHEAGDLRGEWLALWLSGAPCGTCKGDGFTSLTMHAWGSRPTPNPCRECHGAGTALAAHREAMLAACEPSDECDECDVCDLEVFTDPNTMMPTIRRGHGWVRTPPRTAREWMHMDEPGTWIGVVPCPACGGDR